MAEYIGRFDMATFKNFPRIFLVAERACYRHQHFSNRIQYAIDVVELNHVYQSNDDALELFNII